MDFLGNVLPSDLQDIEVTFLGSVLPSDLQDIEVDFLGNVLPSDLQEIEVAFLGKAAAVTEAGLPCLTTQKEYAWLSLCTFCCCPVSLPRKSMHGHLLVPPVAAPVSLHRRSMHGHLLVPSVSYNVNTYIANGTFKVFCLMC